MSRVIRVKVGPLATASANNICLSQTTAGAASLTLNGTLVNAAGVAVLDVPRRVLVTNLGNDAGITFKLYGTDWNGTICSEVLTGTNGLTVYSLYDYATITAITTSGATSASGVTVGTNGLASSRPISLDSYGFGTVAMQVNVTGAANYTIQQSLDSAYPTGYTSIVWINSPDTNVVNSTLSQQTNYAYAPHLVRINLNSGTGSVALAVIQHASPSI